MGRLKNRIPAYYFENTRTGKRFTWFFASRYSALKWRKNHYWRYTEYGTLEEYVNSLDNKHVTERAIEIWEKHKEGFHAMKLRRAYVVLGEEVDGEPIGEE